MNIRKIVVGLAVVAACGLVGAECVWTGAAGDGQWATAGNWSGGRVPGAADVVVFNDAAAVSFSGTGAAAGFVFNAAATVTAGEDSSARILLGTPGSETVASFTVADGVKVDFNVRIYAAAMDQTRLVKEGGGEIKFQQYVGRDAPFDGFEILEGVVRFGFAQHSDGANFGAGAKVVVHDGAELHIGNDNQVMNRTVFDVRAGGLLDFGDKGDVIGGFIGQGVVTNIGGASLTFYGSPLLFAGRAYGRMGPASERDGFASDDPAIIVGTADAFAGVRWLAGKGTVNPLRFAPNIGTFTFERYEEGADAPLALVDTAGQPITLRTGLGSTLEGRMTGAGSLVKTDALASQTVVTGDRLALTGAVGREGGMALVFGDGADEANNVDFSSFGALWNFGPGEYMGFKNVGDLLLDLPVYGDGEFCNPGPGRVTFADLRTTNATINAGSTAPIDIAGGDWKGLTIRQTSCATNTISGGRGDGLRLFPTSAGGVINVTGGSFTNVFLGTSGGAAAYAINILGGELYATNTVDGFAQRTYTVDNAKLTLANGFSAGGGGLYEMFTITNGATATFISAPSWNRGLGFSISDGSTLTLKNTSYYNFRIASDGTSHRWFVGDGGHVISDGFQICSVGSTVASTGTLEIARGGRFTLVGAGIATPSTDLGYGEVVLDGGVFEYAPSGSTGTILESATREAIVVTERGGVIETVLGAPGGNNRQGTLSTKILPRTAAGAVDGGLTKLGVGALSLGSGMVNELCGPFRVLEGNVYAYSPHPFGFGDVYIAHSYITCDVTGNQTQRISDGAGSQVHISGVPLYYLRYRSGEKATLVMGPEDAAADSVLVGDTPNALPIFMTDYKEVNDPFDGTGARVFVNGGVSLTPAGLTSFPALALTVPSENDRGLLRFLTYDAEKGFVAAPLTEGLAGGATSVAKVESAPLTVTADAHVGALRVHAQNGVALTLAGGATLRVGDGVNPALVILNNENAKSQTARIDGAGTLDFGASMGVIAANWARSNTEEAKVGAVIAGSGGLSLVGTGRYYPSLIGLGAANVYTGDTYIDGVQVTISNERALGTGDVHIQGSRAYGGGLNLNVTRLANNLYVRGRGLLRSQNSAQAEGALVFARSATLSGDIEVVDYATFTTKDSSLTHTLTGRLSGGDLTFEGIGTFVFGGDNDLTGTVTVAGCTLRVATGGALGTGPVVNNGVIEFVNEADITVANELRGTGQIILSGAGKVTFTSVKGFAGVVTMGDDTRTLDIGSETMGVAALSGAGRVTGSAGGVLEVAGSTAGSDFGGVISGGISFVKTGAGTQHLSGGNTYAGATEVREGTLALGARKFSTTLTVRDALFQLDASDAGTLEVDAFDRVTRWADALGGPRVFTNVTDYTAFPTRRAAAVNGRDTVWFDGDRDGVNSSLFSETAATGVKTVFGVFQTSADPHPNGWNCAGFFGARGKDEGLRLYGAMQFNAGNNWTEGSAYRVNGAVANTFQSATATVWSVELATARGGDKGLAVGDYWNDPRYLRCLYGDLCEIIAYDRALTAAETEEVTTYLEKKWRNRPDPVGVAENVLPTGTELLVDAAGTLDLAGTPQTVAALTGAGAVIDSTGSGAVLTVTGSLEGFTGTLRGLTLAVPANTTLTLAPRATVSPDCSLRLGDHAVLDLGGQTVTVLNASGTGRVVNGTLIVTGVDSRHGLGTIIIFR
ncbi:MAG: autotransporter-associated beta strand repeat-containing protein [Kiritimatiellia bacterium]